MGEIEKRERNKQFGDMVDPSLASQLITEVRKANQYTLQDLIDLLKQAYPNYDTSMANLANKLTRGTVRFYEVVAMLDVLGYDLYLRSKPDSDANDVNIVIHTDEIEKVYASPNSPQEEAEGIDRQELKEIHDRVSDLSETINDIKTRIEEINKLSGGDSFEEPETVYRLVPDQKPAYSASFSIKEDGKGGFVLCKNEDKRKAVSAFISQLLEDGMINIPISSGNGSTTKKLRGKRIWLEKQKK